MEPEHGNNHHSIVEYRGQWVLFYHRWAEVPGAACRKKQRHVAAEYLYFDGDGFIQKVSRTRHGVADFSARSTKP